MTFTVTSVICPLTIASAGSPPAHDRARGCQREAAPGAANEKQRHAHESIVLVLQDQAFLPIEGKEIALREGDLAYVPRWSVHQTQHRSQPNQLHRLAMTDFGLTCALLGTYDRDTRLKSGGKQAYS